MSTRLAILGILRERSLHGYELKHIISEHMGDWTNIAFGSIYFALSKLREEGLIEATGVYRDGGRPSRTIFSITEKGREEFLRLLREALSRLERQYFDIDLALGFMRALPANEVRKYFFDRAATLKENLSYLENHKKQTMADRKIPREAALIFTHSIAHTRAELAWTMEVLKTLEGTKE